MTVYFKGEESVCINHRTLLVKDLGEIYCSDPELTYQIEKLSLYHFKAGERGKEVFSILHILEAIKSLDKELEFVNLGEKDFIVYYEKGLQNKRYIQDGKIIFVCLVAFFGAAISIMAYNNDVGMDELFGKVYHWMMGYPEKSPGILEISYSIGLAVGIIVFFNHAAKKRLSDDPTPFEVQMRLYEKDVNETFIIGAGRKGQEHN